MDFDNALDFTLREEGGYVDNPLDHGAATCHGITQRTYDAYCRARRVPAAPVAEIADVEVQDIYRTLYWAPARCDDLPTALGVCHFDWAVNHGVTGARATLNECDGDWRRYNQLRRGWYEARAKAHPDQEEFLKGWLGRVDLLDTYAEGLST